MQCAATRHSLQPGPRIGEAPCQFAWNVCNVWLGCHTQVHLPAVPRGIGCDASQAVCMCSSGTLKLDYTEAPCGSSQAGRQSAQKLPKQLTYMGAEAVCQRAQLGILVHAGSSQNDHLPPVHCGIQAENEEPLSAIQPAGGYKVQPPSHQVGSSLPSSASSSAC